MPSSPITSNLRSMRSNARVSSDSSMPSRSRKGGNIEHARPRSAIIAPISRAVCGAESRSFSKISAASSVPLTETVAMDVFMCPDYSVRTGSLQSSFDARVIEFRSVRRSTPADRA